MAFSSLDPIEAPGHHEREAHHIDPTQPPSDGWHALSDEDVRTFARDGYLIARDVIDRHLLTRLIEAADDLVLSDHRPGRSVAGKRHGYVSIRNCVAARGTFLDLVAHPALLSIAVQLLGAHIHLVTSHVIQKKPSTEASARWPLWHRDYGAIERSIGERVPRVMIKCAIALTDTSRPRSGGTLVAPGTNHRDQVAMQAGKPDPAGAIAPTLRPGDCLVFENRTWHAGDANLTTDTRKMIAIGYGYRWLRPIDYRIQEESILQEANETTRWLLGEPLHSDTDYRQVDSGNPLARWCAAHGAALHQEHPGP